MSPIQKVLNAYFDRTMQEALAKFGRDVPGRGMCIVAKPADLRDIFDDTYSSGVPIYLAHNAHLARTESGT